jgi:uncharacterized protein
VTTLLSAAAVLAGAALASATGFGFSLLAAPLLFALLGPRHAVGSMLLLALVVNALILVAEGRRPQPLARTAAVVLASSIPGAFAGALVLRSLPAVALQLVLSVTVLATIVVRRRAVPASGHGGAPLAGFAAGALTTSTSTNGPPLILHLLGRGHAPGEVRDTLTLCFLGMSPIGVAALWATGIHNALPDAGLLAALVPAAVVGQLAGRRAFARLAAGGGYERVLTGVLLLAVAVGLAGAVASA